MNELLATTDLAQWTAWKRVLVDITDLDRDALHILAGVALQLAVAVLTRRRLGDWMPWLAVAAFALIIEAADIAAEVWHSAVLQAGESIHDVVVTMLMPTALLILSRRWPHLAGRS